MSVSSRQADTLQGPSGDKGYYDHPVIATFPNPGWLWYECEAKQMACWQQRSPQEELTVPR